ncbi:hypothetical protein PIB30_021191 [Stylosanthes scabra]|uniref:Uncharacterized protein n=1 Tax=Stylosanthes scabra TaxID=79078 RepID=A0ABU6UBH8_9FABA|nr:hypothetical protein [Stylosanthes scabra]
MCQETLDICLDQVSHLCPGVDFSAITLKSRWDAKGRRVYVPQESDAVEESPQAEEVLPEQQPEATTQVSEPASGDLAGVIICLICAKSLALVSPQQCGACMLLFRPLRLLGRGLPNLHLASLGQHSFLLCQPFSALGLLLPTLDF